MSRELAEMVIKEMGLDGEAGELLLRNIRSLGRGERRCYFQRIKPLEGNIKKFIQGYCRRDDSSLEKVVSITVDSMLEKRGDPDILDSFVMDVVGRLTVYKKLRERSESEGIRLSAFTSFGGLSMVLFAVVIITAIVLYIKYLP
ncbi:MAG: hypothetical protein ACOY30_06770 [Bacillota bacterium]